ncbi:uncharacterized protein MEPE_00881 [Melanopsichium pennsylvanicum]|uniref:Uncharacterized protein n=1 Tax=Melanopsichium pennsylvanicum TaxID=63383 RepID=A0AAJ4XGR5_9BASI|nr:uncharacterized protein MEPE_00881 [Melanopsichium pennsylvanicum]
MKKKLEEITTKLVGSSQQTSTEKAPQWLSRLLEDAPGLPADAAPHNRARHADLQGAIADASFHPSIEACLHLINSDLYSAHFLVRKAQGGSRYLDWLHAILHKLEGDFRNAKMWYTDLGKFNTGALDKSSQYERREKEQGKAETFHRYHEFWFVNAANGGKGERTNAKDLDLNILEDIPRKVRLTAHEHTDLVFLSTLATKASSSSAISFESVQRDLEQHYRTTTLSEGKIQDSQSAFTQEELRGLYQTLSRDEHSSNIISDLTRFELIWMLASLIQDFGWRRYEMMDTMEALKVESTPAHEKVDEERKNKASNMVLDPGKGQRKF